MAAIAQRPVLAVISSELRPTDKLNSTHEKVENTLTEELIFGICAPIGSLHQEVISELKKQLETDFKYTVHVIKLSELISKYERLDTEPKLNQTQAFTNLMAKIKGGDDWERTTMQAMEDANVVIVGMSTNYLTSPFCMEQEFKRVMALCQQRRARVIGVYLREVAKLGSFAVSLDDGSLSTARTPGFKEPGGVPPRVQGW